MDKLVRCQSCQGQKMILGLGGIKKDCVACKGIGSIEVLVEKPKVRQRKKKESIAPSPIEDDKA